MGYFYEDGYDLACKLLNLDPEVDNSEEIQDLLLEKYNLEFEDFNILVHDLLPLCGEGESPLTGKYYVGFCDRENDEWLLKMDYDEL